MSTATIPAQAPEEQRVLLEGMTWDHYRDLERIVDEQPGLRLTYVRGRLELMTLSHLHESVKMLMHDLLVILADEFDVSRKNGGSTAFRRKDLDRGLEPDQCYYLENEPLVRGRTQLDLTVDPPPDLVIEIEISRSVLDRLGTFAAMGVPEIWCTDGKSLRFLALTDAGEYETRPESRFFPGIRSADMERFLKNPDQLDEGALVRSFREWVQQMRTQGGEATRN